MQSRARTTADRLLARHGGEATLLRTETIPPENSWESPTVTTTSTPVQFTETGVELDLVDGQTVQEGDLVGMLSASVEPELIDLLRVNGRIYTLLSIRPVQPAPGEPITHFSIHGRA
mgnify:CR=1 FL=1